MRVPKLIVEALNYLDSAGVAMKSRDRAPLLHRAVWSLGVSLPPPLFCGPVTNAALSGLAFAIGWGTMMGVFRWLTGQSLTLSLVVLALLAGGVMGCVDAYRWAGMRHQFGIPDWRAHLKVRQQARH